MATDLNYKTGLVLKCVLLCSRYQIKVGYNIDNRNGNDDATKNFIGRVRTNKRVTRVADT